MKDTVELYDVTARQLRLFPLFRKHRLNRQVCSPNSFQISLTTMAIAVYVKRSEMLTLLTVLNVNCASAQTQFHQHLENLHLASVCRNIYLR